MNAYLIRYTVKLYRYIEPDLVTVGGRADKTGSLCLVASTAAKAKAIAESLMKARFPHHKTVVSRPSLIMKDI